MTDLEMTKRCALAIGWDTEQIEIADIHGRLVAGEDKKPLVWTNGSIYDPLCNDTQAMALVKCKFLEISFKSNGEDVLWICQFGHGITPPFAVSTNLNRAIVECVAKMQLSK